MVLTLYFIILSKQDLGADEYLHGQDWWHRGNLLSCLPSQMYEAFEYTVCFCPVVYFTMSFYILHHTNFPLLSCSEKSKFSNVLRTSCCHGNGHLGSKFIFVTSQRGRETKNYLGKHPPLRKILCRDCKFREISVLEVRREQVRQ